MTSAVTGDFSDIEVGFQAISNIHTGQCFGYEVLLRGWERFALSSAEEMLAAAAAAGRLADLELAIRRQAAARLGGLPDMGEKALFINLDHRAGEHWDDVVLAARTLLEARVSQLVTEIAAFPDSRAGLPGWLRTVTGRGGMLAIDHFGATADGFGLLAACDPDFIKVDPSLLRGIDTSARKRVLLAQLVGMAHTLGIEVVAVGVETGLELTVCRELGCDLVQGDLVQPPLLDTRLAVPVFPHVEALARDDRRRRQLDQKWVLQQLDPLPAIRVDTPLRDVFTLFGRNASVSIIPVVDGSGRALGLLRERELKNFAYSAFGKDLMANKGLGRKLYDYLVRCPLADIGTPLDQMLAVYATVEDADGILVTERMVYRGFLSARSILRAMHEKTLARARDENPLTKLPGNELITDYLGTCLAGGDGAVLAYIDFDNFKPFNDYYGFRQGDRAILLFAELSRKQAQGRDWFIGHIGGDDFFIGIRGEAPEAAAEAVAALIARFAFEAESFYDAEARERRCIYAQDREGAMKTFPLLSASAVVLEVPPGCRQGTVDEVSAAIAAHKKQAKSSPGRLVRVALSGFGGII